MKIHGSGQLIKHVYKRAPHLLILLLLAILISACADESKPSPSSSIPPNTIRGVIRIASDNAVDSDVNDPNVISIANNNQATAQLIPNPGTLGGYVNVAGSGPAGRSFAGGDPSDYYLTHLTVGQVITLKTSATDSTLSLKLVNRSTGTTQTGFNNNGTQTITIDQQEDYYIWVEAVSGAANYILNIALSASNVTANTAYANVSDNLDINSDFVPGEVIVKFRQDPTIQSQQFVTSAMTIKTASLGLTKKAGAADRDMLMNIDDITNNNLAFKAQSNTASIASTDAARRLKQDTIDTIRSLRKRDDVIDARPNYVRKAYAIPNDEYFDLQWNYQMINLPSAWDITKGSPTVTVAVIDTGVLLNHRDLADKLVAGYDFIRNNRNSGDKEPGIDNNPDDVGDNPGQSSFHGTHVAGTIGAATDNNLGVAGVGWNVKIMPLRVLGRDGGTDYDIEQAILFAAGASNDSGTLPDKRADVINLSLGGPSPLSAIPNAYTVARDNNVIVVAAAGNAGPDQAIPYITYPAAINGVVAVGAVDIFKEITTYSNFGFFLDITAPGGNFDRNKVPFDGHDGILSTSADDSNLATAIEDILSFQTGTSMASPHVAGVAALMKSIYPALTPTQFDILLANGLLTEDLGPAGRDERYGHGLVDALKAVTQATELSNGSVLDLPAKAVIFPAVLDLSNTIPTLPFSINNYGTQALAVTDIRHDDDNWLEINAVSVDTDGIGDYLVGVNRSNLTNGHYSATVTFTTNVGEVSMLIYMQVKPASLVDSVGLQYVTLLNLENLETTRIVATKNNSNQYQFSFPNITPGQYNIESSTNLNNNQTSCVPVEEACARYVNNTGLPITLQSTSTNTFPALELLSEFKLNPTITTMDTTTMTQQKYPIPLQ